MAAPRGEATGRLSPLRAFPIVAVAASIVAVALHYNGFVPSRLTVPRAATTFDIRKNAVYACPMDRISRIFYDRCVSCHRPNGTSFSLMTYLDVQPRAVAIRDAVLSRRMPPWGAVKGFGDFRNDQALTAEQIELITDWIQDDTPKGNNPRMLPPQPRFTDAPVVQVPADHIRVADTFTLKAPMVLDGLLPERAADATQIVAVRPNGKVEPLLWLYEYDERHQHPFLLRKPLMLEAGTIIRGVRPPDSVLLLPATSSGTR